MRNAFKILVEKPKEYMHCLGYQDICGRIILKWIGACRLNSPGLDRVWCRVLVSTVMKRLIPEWAVNFVTK
jgi:hypothetical protein